MAARAARQSEADEARYDLVYANALANATYETRLVPTIMSTIPSQSSLAKGSGAFSPAQIQMYSPTLHDVARTSDTADAFGEIMSNTMPTTSDQAGNLGAKNGRCFLGASDTFAWALAPVVYHISREGLNAGTVQPGQQTVGQIAVLPFAIVATSYSLAGKVFPGTVQPEYVSYTPGPNVTVNLDMTYIGRRYQDTVMSIAASALALAHRWIRPTIYITMYPLISQDSYNVHVATVRSYTGIKDLAEVSCFAFEGASCGLAAAAAIAGLPPMMYTGYMSTQGVNKIFTKQGPGGPQEVLLGSNVIDSVRELEWKALWAIKNATPLIIPHNTVWANQEAIDLLKRAQDSALTIMRKGQEPIATALGRQDSMLKDKYKNVGTIAWAFNFRNYMYSMQQWESGASYALHGSWVCTASRFAEVQMMAALVAAHLYKLPKPLATARVTDLANIAGRMQNFAVEMVTKKRASAAISKAKSADKPKVKTTLAQRAAAKQARKAVSKQVAKQTKKITRMRDVTKADAALLTPFRQRTSDVVYTPAVSYVPPGPTMESTSTPISVGALSDAPPAEGQTQRFATRGIAPRDADDDDTAPGTMAAVMNIPWDERKAYVQNYGADFRSKTQMLPRHVASAIRLAKMREQKQQQGQQQGQQPRQD